MEQENIREITTDMIDDPEFAMRTELDRNQLWELADNIKQNGLINPITVRPKNGRYEVVAGHRRFSACKIAGKIKIKCVVRELSDDKVFEIMSAENLERADVDPVDEGNFLRREMERTNKSSADLARQIRRSVQYVEDRLAIGGMPDYLQTYLKEKQIKIGVALHLNKIDNDSLRRMWVDMAVRDGISVAQAEYWVRGYEINKLPGGNLSDTPPDNFEPSEPNIVLFECIVDGKKYDSRLFKMISVYEGNFPLLEEALLAIRKFQAET